MATSLDGTLLRTSMHTHFLNEPPACILIAPSDPTLVVIGTYLYVPDEGKKSGNLLLYRKPKDNSSLEILQSHSTHAILDIKFSPHDPDYLATAQSSGCLRAFRLDRGSSPPTLIETQKLYLFDPDVLLLSLTFSPTNPELLACTLSTGGVAIVRPSLPRNDRVEYEYQPHIAEAWTCEFSPDGRTLFSGGDDSALNAQDLETQQSLWKDRRTHGAGVTAIMARPDSRTLLTGSYDDTFRVWDLQTRGVSGQINLGGGVWRLGKQGSSSVIASCMYVGARVVDLGQDCTSPSVVARFEEHESMNYDCDIHPSDLNTVVSCSFYDKRVCIWDVKSE